MFVGDVDGDIIDLYSIEKPINHESGWDNDDKVIVFRSKYIVEDDFKGKFCLYSDSWWTKFRLGLGKPFGYNGLLGCKVTNGEIRVYVGTRGKFLVNLKTIKLILIE